MPELPEVESVRLSLSPLLQGRTISGFELYWPNTLEAPTQDIFEARILSNRFKVMQRRGKFIVMPLQSGDRITVHLRMTGVLRYYRPDVNPELEPEGKYLRALFRLHEGSSLAFFDVRKFGRIRLVNPEEWDAFQSHLGIEPLSSAFSEGEFQRILQSRRRQIKALLLDQRVIAGLGNIYVDESLFMAKIHPRALSNSIDSLQVRDLHHAIVQILERAIENRGTTFSDYRNGLGDSGSNQSALQIYGKTTGLPCPRCETPVERTIVAQRGTVFCPSCQQISVNEAVRTQ